MSIWNYWLHLSTVQQALIAGVITKHLVTLARLVAARYRLHIDGLGVHGLAVAISLIGGLASQLPTGGSAAGVVTTVYVFAGATLTAIGYNELAEQLKATAQSVLNPQTDTPPA